MKKEEIHLLDWQRILIGQAPWIFMIEIIIRVLIIYIFLLLAMRMMGKRMTAQMSIFELSIVVMLGGIVSIPMQVPDQGILIGIFILMLTVLLHWILNIISFQNGRLESLTQGKSSIILKNGQLKLKEMKIASISRESLFANLRSQDIRHLGQLERIYLETNGDLSLYRTVNNNPGLSIMPDSDNDLKLHSKSLPDYFACTSCGRIEQTKNTPVHACPDCGNKDWLKAVN